MSIFGQDRIGLPTFFFVRLTLLTHPVLPGTTASWSPVVRLAIDASLQATEAHLTWHLAVVYARSIQVDCDRLTQPVSVQHKQVSQVATQGIVLDSGVELAQEADQVDASDAWLAAIP